MEITIKDYTGFNDKCTTVQNILKFIKSKKKVTMAEIFEFGKLHAHHGEDMLYYIPKERKKEYQKWYIDYFSNEISMGKIVKEIRELENKKYKLEKNIDSINPTKAYLYFLNMPQKNITNNQYDSVLDSVLNNILQCSIFEINDYFNLYHVLRPRYQYHNDSEIHYKIAIQSGNNTAYHSIEHFLNRPPFIIDKRRCFEGFEFIASDDNKYRCTGFKDGNIKFVYHLKFKGRKPSDEKRYPSKRVQFTREQFKLHFKNLKIVN